MIDWSPDGSAVTPILSGVATLLNAIDWQRLTVGVFPLLAAFIVIAHIEL